MTPSEKIVAKLTPKEQKPVLDPEIKAWVDFVKKSRKVRNKERKDV